MNVSVRIGDFHPPWCWMRRLQATATFWLIALCTTATAADESIDFGKQIAPMLEQHCSRCHSTENNKGDVSLATFDDLKSNEYVIAGDPDGSYLIELVTSQDGEPPAMPLQDSG